jgi:hypothetical protein
MHFHVRLIAIFSVCFCTFLCAGQGYASEYEPIRAGGFLFAPNLTLEQRYDDNIYADDENKETDFATAVKPSLIIKKLYRDHEFMLSGDAEAVRYYNHSEENMFNFKTELAGRVTARRVLTLPFKLSYGVDHTDRLQERGAAQSSEPTRFDALRAEAGAEYNPGRLMLGVYGGYNQFRYENGKTFSGAAVVHEDGDYDSLYLRTIARYKTRTNWTPFISLQVSENNFLRRAHEGAGFTGLKRDNRVVRGLGGVEFEYHDLLKGSAALGQDWRKYEEAAIDDIKALSAEGHIEWMPFRKTKLNLDFLRQSEEDNLVNEGVVETKATFGIDYELRSNLFMDAGAEWKISQFENTDRTDNLYGGSVGLRYILNKRLEAGASYLHRWRSSTDEDQDFGQNIFMLRLTGKL